MFWNESAWIMFFAGAALKSTAVLGAAWLLALGLRGPSAAARDLVWIAALAALPGSLGLHDAVGALETRPGSMRMSFGLLRPAVFLPADAAEWDQERRHMVLLHELAHVRRGDFAAHLLARTALGLYWWNPL